MSFFRHREIFRSDVIRLVRERRNRRSPAHRLDEFPVGYSSASCTPAALASASPTGIHSATWDRCRTIIFQPTANSVLTFCVTPGDNRTLWALALLVPALIYVTKRELKIHVMTEAKTERRSHGRRDFFSPNLPKTGIMLASLGILREVGLPALQHSRQKSTARIEPKQGVSNG
jgi:hypothetical protein